ncbi:MAG: DUF61 family protein [Deltaproteobacteria bacterium]|nr:DUF61 family protein [Deltaproteobacteria bacterium]
MSKEDEALTTLLKTELSSINRGIVKRRKSLADLLKNPAFEEGDNAVELDKVILEEIANKLTSPSSEVLLPVTVYLPSGTSEGYITGEREASTADELGADGISRGGKYWLQKYRAKSLSHKYPDLFQIFYTV